jgi:CDP-paratose 2-epimerase
VWKEFGQLLAELNGEAVRVSYRDWRPGDQPCYVSDIRNVGRDLGWTPEVDKRAGIRRLWEWVSSNKEVFRTDATVRAA